jgi:hypothetical protein
LLAHGQWFSPGSPVSSTTKTGRHDIAEILLKVALRHKKSPKKSIMWNRRRLTLESDYLPLVSSNIFEDHFMVATNTYLTVTEFMSHK